MNRQYHQRLIRFSIVVSLWVVSACDESVVAPRMDRPGESTFGSSDCPQGVPCDVREFTPGELDGVYNNLSYYYQFGRSAECDGILEKAYERLNARGVSYLDERAGQLLG